VFFVALLLYTNIRPDTCEFITQTVEL